METTFSNSTHATENNTNPKLTAYNFGLQSQIKKAVTNYLQQLDGEKPNGVYDLFLREMELPLLEHILKYTKNNQSKAAIYLGISRGTLRKRMKAYQLLDETQ